MDINDKINDMFNARINSMNRRMNLFNHEKKVLQNLDLFVLDNSLRENAVGGIRGHSIENRWNIYNEVKKCGFQHMAVASFNHMTITGELFLKDLKAKGEDLSNQFAFVEFLDKDEPPKGLPKCKEHGINNVVLEMDLMFSGIDYTVYNSERICQLLTERIHWIRANLSPNSLILVNIRDFADAMAHVPARVFYLVNFLGSMPEGEKIFGLCFEDSGMSYSEQLAVWTSCIREEMDRCNWSGHLLTNIHEQYGMGTMSQMDCLADGATGVWAGLSEEGATMGHISSTLVIMNLIRVGNTKVLAKYKCNRLNEASHKVTCVVTGKPPHPRQPSVGDRALGICYEMPKLDDDVDLEGSCASSIARLSHQSSLKKILAKLQFVYGENERFSKDVAKKMKEIMAQDHGAGKFEDYNSKFGIAQLFERAGGQLIPEMQDNVNKLDSTRRDQLFNVVRQMWNEWDLSGNERDGCLDYFGFYNGFMAPYFGNSRSNETTRLLQAIGFLKDGCVFWERFLPHLQFAFGEHPDTETAEELVNVAFRESLIVTMIELLIEESQTREKFYKDYEYQHDEFFTSSGQEATSVREEAPREPRNIDYNITVKTGNEKGSSKTVKANVVLHGRWGETESMNLESTSEPSLFQPGMENTFTVNGNDVGQLQKISLTHDYEGYEHPSPRWFVESVSVNGVDFAPGQWVQAKETNEFVAKDEGKRKKRSASPKQQQQQEHKSSQEEESSSCTVTIKTADELGTSQMVDASIKLHGKYGTTEQIKLNNSNSKQANLFARGQENSFVFANQNVGHVERISLFYDYEGYEFPKPKWCVENVNVDGVDFGPKQWIAANESAEFSEVTEQEEVIKEEELATQEELEEEFEEFFEPEKEEEELISYDIFIKTSSFESNADDVYATIGVFGDLRSTGFMPLEAANEDKKKVFSTTVKTTFQCSGLEVGKIEKIKLQLWSDGPASWGVETVSVKCRSEFITFKAYQTIEQNEDPSQQEHNYRDIYHSTLQLLPDREEVPTIPYQLTMKTKNYEGFGADTESAVHVTMFGEKGNTGKIKIEVPGGNTRKIFDKINSHQYVINAPDVGNISSMRITHENKEKTAKWYLDYASVMTDDYEVQFTANKWLDKSSYRDQLQIDLFACKAEDVSFLEDEVEYLVKFRTIQAINIASAHIMLHGRYGSSERIMLDKTTTRDDLSIIELFDEDIVNNFKFTAADVGSVNRISFGYDLEDEDYISSLDVENITVSVPSQNYSLIFNYDGAFESTADYEIMPRLVDNPDYRTTYHVICKTGVLPEASTDANVYIVFIGDNGETGQIELDNDGSYDLFEDDSEDILTVQAPEVGSIHSIKIGHDNEGRSANWYLEGVDVIHPHCNESLDFTGNCWLGDSISRRDGGDRKVEKQLYHVTTDSSEEEISYDIELKCGKYEGPKDAKVSLVINGESFNTGKLNLDASSGQNEHIFDSSRRNLFELKGIDVGDLYKLRISHNNPDGEAMWYLDYVVVKTRMYYMKINVDKWLQKNERTGELFIDVFPPKEEKLAKVKYNMVLNTFNYHGFDYDTEIDPVWVCVFGDEGNTGYINWKQPEADKLEIFDKNNKHYLTFEAANVGKVDCVRVIHTNYSHSSEWNIEWVSIKKDGETVRMKSKEWMEQTKCDSRLQADMYTQKRGQDEKTYIVKVKTSDLFECDTNANVYINIFGSNGETGNIALETEEAQTIFERNSEMEFVLRAKDIGRVYKINIGHDDSSLGAKWHLDSVHLDMPQEGRTLLFSARRWLDSAEGDHQIDVDLYPKIEDNPDNTTTYHVATKTGDIPDASTDANVYVILCGQNGCSGKISLDALGAEVDLFEQDQEDVFTFKCADVGPLTSIKIGHDDNGRSSDWYLRWISVVCPANKDSNTLFADRWFSRDHGDGTIDCELSASEVKEEIDYDVIVKSSHFETSGSYASAALCIYGEKRSTAMIPLEGYGGLDPMRVFKTEAKQMFELEGIEVGKVKKIRVQLISDGPTKWGLETIALKVKGEYTLFKIDQTMEQTRDVKTDENNFSNRYQTGLQIFPEKKETPLIPYTVTIKTNNYRGFSADTDSDTHIIFFGEKANSGRLKFEFPGDNRRKMFDKMNPHTYTFNAVDVGPLTNIRVTHSNNEGTAEWLLDYVNVTVNEQETKFHANKWLEKSVYRNQLYVDLFAPIADPEATTDYEIKVQTGSPASEGSNISVMLHGKYGSTGQIKLNGEGTENTFNANEKDVGPIQRIYLSHEYAGEEPEPTWSVEHVTVSAKGRSLKFAANELDANTGDDLFPMLEDNKDNYTTYHVITKTGTLPEASTDANVHVVLYGDNGETQHVALDVDVAYDLFEHDQEDIITVQAPNVGTIQKMTIGHDNEGRSANWYLVGVDVIHPAVNESIDFAAHCWLGDAIARRDGGSPPIEKELFHVGNTDEGDEIGYDIEIKTGNYEGPAEGNVNICIIGQDYNTGRLPLEGAKFDKTSRQLFSLKGIDVGDLHKLRLTHSNPKGLSRWYVDYVVVKTRMYYMKIKVDSWMNKNDRTGELFIDLIPPEEEEADRKKYQIILNTGNYHGFDYDSDIDPVWLCIYGDKGNTGLINWKSPADDKLEVFDKNNKHYMTFESDNVGKINSIRVIHTNYAGNSQWMLDWVQVKTDDQNIKFRAKKWLEQTECDGRLQLDLFTAKPASTDLVLYEVAVKTGDVNEAGTGANVHINFHGTYGETGDIPLENFNSTGVTFQRGQVDNFEFRVLDVGRVEKISIGHDDSGANPRWFLENVVVTMPSSNQTIKFAAGRWLDSVGGLDHKTEIDLYPKIEDNPDNKIVYHIATKTGDLPDSSTDANVFVELFGANGTSGQIQLDSSSSTDLFEQDMEDIFTVTAPDVGPIHKIKIGHDNQGYSGDWFVRWVDIHCPCKLYSKNFDADFWISTDKGQLELEYEILAEKEGTGEIPYDVTFKSSSFVSSAKSCHATICMYGEKRSTAMLPLEGPNEDKMKVFDVKSKPQFQLEALDVGKVKKLRVQLFSDGPAKWGLDSVVLKYADEYKLFKCTEEIEQEKDISKDGHNYAKHYYTSAVLYAETKEVPLIDYDVKIKTNNYSGFSADTDSDVHITFFGDKGNSGKQLFTFPGGNRKKMFDKNDAHAYSFQAKDVGKLTSIRITHSNNEKTCHWLLDHVTVTVNDSETKFTADQWLTKSTYRQQLHIDLFAPRTVSEEPNTLQYEVQVTTGSDENAGTTGKVSVELHGVYGSTGKVLLDSQNTTEEKLFESGMTNTFNFYEKDVGKIQRISIHHEGDTEWLCDTMKVHIRNQNYSLVFSSGQWFSNSGVDDYFPLLKDNKDNYTTYHVICKTGTLPEASTDANVYVIFVGDNGHTAHVQLETSYDSDAIVDLFEDNQEDIITVSAPDVGAIHSIKVGHDNQGRSADWYVEGLDVVHPSYQESISFNANCWLGGGVTRRDGGNQVVETELFHVGAEDGDGEIAYELEIKSGSYTGPADAKVNVTIMGNDLNTGSLPLEHPVSQDKTFDTSARQLFSLLGMDVGPLFKLRISHLNPGGECKWYIDWLVVKTRMYYAKIKVDQWLQHDERTGYLYLDVFPPEPVDKDITYNITLNNGNYHGFDPDTEVDPVWLCLYGDKGNTGLINWKAPSGDKTEVFGKTNKHYMTIKAVDVGKLDCIRVIHTNYAGNAEWQIDWISVKTSSQYIKFKSKQWLTPTDCDGRLQIDIYAPKPKEDLVAYKVKVQTGDMMNAETKALGYVNFIGTHGETGNLPLAREDDVAPFQRGAVDEFHVSGKNVGRVNEVRIGHDDSDANARWYLERVDVEVPEQHQELHFTVSRWLDSAGQYGGGGGSRRTEVTMSPKIKENPSNMTTYHISAKTGDLHDASTDANVYVILCGDNGETDRLKLDDYGQGGDLFEQDNEDHFTIVAPDVGLIRSIKVGHDDQGNSPDWFVRWVSVVAPTQHYSQNFSADKWVSSIEGDMKIEYEIMASNLEKERYIYYDITFQTSGYTGLDHDYGKIHVMLFGDKTNTGELQIDLPEGDELQLFDKSNKHTVEVKGINVGPVTKVKIIHDNLKNNARWKLSWVKVTTHLFEGRFSGGGQWFEKNEDNNKLEGVLLPKAK